MRPQQQNRRMRGRNNSGGGNNNNNNNRKGPNPLTRNYESNGPDVKIRGSAQQIAEKYAQLARDAHSSGDRVMAENYLQHAEHYNRIIAAAQAQMPIQNMQNQRDGSDDDWTKIATSSTIRTMSARAISARANVGGPAQSRAGQLSGQSRPEPGQPEQRQRRHSRSRSISAPSWAPGRSRSSKALPAEVALNPEAPARAAPAASAISTGPTPANGEGRRNRRPRRGERSRPETSEDDEPASDGLVATLSRGAPVAGAAPQEPAADAQADGDTALIDADN